MAEPYRIAELAGEFGLTLRALRFYEERGLISPTRRRATRLYSEEDRRRLIRIVELTEYDFSLTEIKGMLDMPEHEMLPLLHEQKSRLEEVAKKTAASLRAITEVIAKISNRPVA